MSSYQVIVSSIRSLSVDQPPLDVLDLLPRPITVRFDDSQVARLDPSHPQFEWNKKLLADFQAAGLRVYVEITPTGSSIQTLLLPLSGKVVFLSRDASGDINFDLSSSAKPFLLKSSHPKYSYYLDVLQEAQLDRSPILVTETDDGDELLDIRRDENPPLPAQIDPAALPPALLPTAVPTVTVDRAAELFALVAACSCDPAVIVDLCIPFLFPDNGCHARAHQMCKLIIQQGEQPSKIWNYPASPFHPLAFLTKNAPLCKVRWSFHVAVTLSIQGPRAATPQSVVLDPALFPHGPVSVPIWRSVQNDPHSQLAFTSPGQYLPPYIDDSESDPVADLRYWEHRLQLRAGLIPFDCPEN